MSEPRGDVLTISPTDADRAYTEMSPGEETGGGWGGGGGGLDVVHHYRRLS